MQGFEDYTFDDKVFKAALYNNSESSARREFDMLDDATLQLLFQDCDDMYHRHPRSGNKFKVYFEIKMSYNRQCSPSTSSLTLEPRLPRRHSIQDVGIEQLTLLSKARPNEKVSSYEVVLRVPL